MSIERRRRDTVPAANLGGGHAGFLLAQDGDDLLFRKPALTHHPSPLRIDGL
jgi:hypothetical protein